MSLSQHKRDENDKKSEIPISTSCFGYQISWRGSWKSFSVVGPSLQISGELSSVAEHGKAGGELGGFVRKPENWPKTFPHKTGPRRNIRLQKKLLLSKVFLDRAVCKCFGNSYSLSAFARAGIQLLQSPGLKLQKSANSKELLHFTSNFSLKLKLGIISPNSFVC